MSHVAAAVALFIKVQKIRKKENYFYQQQKEQLVCLNLTVKLIHLLILFEVSFTFRKNRGGLL